MQMSLFPKGTIRPKKVFNSYKAIKESLFPKGTIRPNGTKYLGFNINWKSLFPKGTIRP